MCSTHSPTVLVVLVVVLTAAVCFRVLISFCFLVLYGQNVKITMSLYADDTTLYMSFLQCYAAFTVLVNKTFKGFKDRTNSRSGSEPDGRISDLMGGHEWM